MCPKQQLKTENEIRACSVEVSRGPRGRAREVRGEGWKRSRHWRQVTVHPVHTSRLWRPQSETCSATHNALENAWLINVAGVIRSVKGASFIPYDRCFPWTLTPSAGPPPTGTGTREAEDPYLIMAAPDRGAGGAVAHTLHVPPSSSPSSSHPAFALFSDKKECRRSRGLGLYR